MLRDSIRQESSPTQVHSSNLCQRDRALEWYSQVRCRLVYGFAFQYSSIVELPLRPEVRISCRCQFQYESLRCSCLPSAPFEAFSEMLLAASLLYEPNISADQHDLRV